MIEISEINSLLLMLNQSISELTPEEQAQVGVAATSIRDLVTNAGLPGRFAVALVMTEIANEVRTT